MHLSEVPVAGHGSGRAPSRSSACSPLPLRRRRAPAVLAALLLLASAGCPEPEPDPQPPSPGCPDGQIDDGGECVPLECGTGTWGWLDPADAALAVFVAPDGSDDGDGTQGAPLASIGDGWDLAREVGAEIVAVAAGTFEESLELVGQGPPVELRGRCQAMVELGGGPGEPAVHVLGAQVGLSSLTVAGGDMGFWAEAGMGALDTTVSMRDVRITGSALAGILAIDSGTSISLERVTVDGILADEDGNFGVGIEAESGAAVDASDVRIEDTEGVGLFLGGEGTAVTGERIVVDGAGGLGVHLQESALLQVDGIEVVGTLPAGGDLLGYGINVTTGSELLATRLLVEDCHVGGLSGSMEGTRIVIDDSAIRRTRRRDDAPAGNGIGVLYGASLEATDLVLEQNDTAGLVLTGEGSSALLLRVSVDRTGEGVLGAAPSGVAVYGGASLDASELAIERTAGTGLVASGPGTAVALDASEVASGFASGDGTDGHGVHVQLGASLVASGLRVLDNVGVGVGVIHEGSSIDLSDSEVRATRSTPGWFSGRGIGVTGGGLLVARRVVAADNKQAGWVFSGGGTSGDLVDCDASATDPSSEPGGGVGLIVQQGAQVTATRLTAAGNAAPGVVVQSGGTLDLVDGDLGENGFAGAAALDDGHLAMVGGNVYGTLPSAEFGGGVGVYSWDDEHPSALAVDGVAFDDLLGPAVYLAGTGDYRVSGCSFSGSGAGGLPGGVFASGGIGRRVEAAGGDPATGLLVEGCSFASLAGDGILLDESSATLAGNEFQDMAGLDVYVQRCGGVLPPLVDGEEAGGAWCQTTARNVQPGLEYAVYLSESGLEQ